MDDVTGLRYPGSIAPAPVVVAVDPAPPPPALGAALLAACSSAARPRECVLAGDPGTADAVVRWESAEAVRVHVKVTGKGPGSPERVLAFRSEDREADRWSAAGLVVAAMVEDAAEEESAPPPPPPPPPEPIPAPPRVWLSVSALIGRGLSPGPPRYGADLHLFSRVADWPLFVVAGITASRSGEGPEGIEPSWVDGSLGVGGLVEFARARTVLRLRLEGVIERQALTQRDAPEDSGSRILDGLRLGLDGSWPSDAPVALLAGVSGQALSGGTAARVSGQKVASFPAHSYAFFLGVDIPIAR